MMYGHYPNKIEKSHRYGKALRVTFLLLLCLFLRHGATTPARATGTGAHTAAHCAGATHPAGAMSLDGGELRERGPRAAAMGGCATALGGGAAALYNPAMLLEEASGGAVFWSPARFGLTELGSVAGSWVQSLGGWSASLSLQRFGFDLYAEHRIGCAAAVTLARGVSAGLRFSALHVRIARYGSIVVPLVDAGVSCRFGEGFSAAATGFALNMPSIDDEERLPAALSLGVAWEDEDFSVTFDAEKEARTGINLRMGAEYHVFGLLSLRCGAATRTREWTAGIGLRRSSLHFAYAIALHSELGATHTVGIGFEP